MCECAKALLRQLVVEAVAWPSAGVYSGFIKTACFLADEVAIKSVWSSTGASGTKPCMTCNKRSGNKKPRPLRWTDIFGGVRRVGLQQVWHQHGSGLVALARPPGKWQSDPPSEFFRFAGAGLWLDLRPDWPARPDVLVHSLLHVNQRQLPRRPRLDRLRGRSRNVFLAATATSITTGRERGGGGGGR